MNPWLPDELRGKDGSQVTRELFGETATESSSWSLNRLDEDHFTWHDRRLGLTWKASHGFLVGLQEVSTTLQATTFAKRNKIRIIQNGGMLFRDVAEILIQCRGLPPVDVIAADDAFKLRFRSGVEASVSYGSFLFQRLVIRPAAEQNPDMPDPSTISTLVISSVDKSDAPGLAEVCLFHLREKFPRSRFTFSNLLQLGPAMDDAESDGPSVVADCAETSMPWTVAFFNRAKEAEPLSGFLYFYRVLEACFDVAIDDEVAKWRQDQRIQSAELVRNIRRLTQKEDIWALRRVMSALIDQQLLDDAHANGILNVASADELTDALYRRRNEIAHGRRGQHDRVLVPFGFSLGDASHRDVYWYHLMGRLACAAMKKWILV